MQTARLQRPLPPRPREAQHPSFLLRALHPHQPRLQLQLRQCWDSVVHHLQQSPWTQKRLHLAHHPDRGRCLVAPLQRRASAPWCAGLHARLEWSCTDAARARGECDCWTTRGAESKSGIGTCACHHSEWASHRQARRLAQVRADGTKRIHVGEQPLGSAAKHRKAMASVGADG